MKRLILSLLLLGLSANAYALEDTYRQSFDSMEDGATVNGADSFTVSQGSPTDAMVQSGDTAKGSGKALKLVNSATAPDVSRTAAYGSVSPTWIEYTVKPGLGKDQRDVPTTGIAAVNFSPAGDILVSDGANWIKTGKTYSSATWYHISMKLDFSTHTYSVYCSPAAIPKIPFVPDKENLHFIDTNISSLNTFGFKGTYNTKSTTNSFVDEVVVHTIDKLQFVTAPQTVVKGHASGMITVQLQNANSEPQTAWTDITIELRSSASTGEFSLDRDGWAPISSITLPEGSREVSFYYKDFTLGHPTISVNEYPDHGWTDALQEQRVVSEGEYFGITATTPQVAGKPFTVQIVAKDTEGNIDTSYNGTADVFATYVSPVTGSKIISPDTITDFSEGVKELSMSYPDAGTIKISVRDRNNSFKVGYSGDILFIPNSFGVAASGPQIVSKNFPLTVSALSAEGTVATNYKGTVKLTPQAIAPSNTAAGALNPSEVTAEQFQNGLASLNSSYNRWGSMQIKAADSDFPEQKGQSETLNFAPKAVSIMVKPPSSSRNFFYVNENMDITVSMLNNDNLPIENFAGTVSISPTPQFNVPAAHTFSDTDKGKKSFIVPAPAAGNYKVRVEDTADGLHAETDNIEVKDATIHVSTTTAPVGTTVVEVQLLDSKGRRITSENEMTVTILFQEENENGTVFFSELGKPILFKKGLAKVVLGDTEAETVTISAKSRFGLKVVDGKVTFGRAGASGVGTLMLRETKD